MIRLIAALAALCLCASTSEAGRGSHHHRHDVPLAHHRHDGDGARGGHRAHAGGARRDDRAAGVLGGPEPSGDGRWIARSDGNAEPQVGARRRTGVALRATGGYSGGPGPRPFAWCGWWMRQQVGRDPGVAYNLARNWTHWGSATFASIGAVVVWPHHVGMITGRAENGQWIVKSGNDGHVVRERARALGGAIAFRRN